MKRIKTALEWGSAIFAGLGTLATIVSDRHIHAKHAEHSPCDCRGTCLSCLRG